MPKIVIAQMKHETNTFSPLPTPLERFSRAGDRLLRGDEAVRAFAGTGTGLGAMIEAAEAAGAQYTLPIAASAWPSGMVEDEAFEAICSSIVADVSAGCDAVLLDLHGAMVTRSYDDGEGELLRRIRAVAPDVPIGVVLDMHANLSEEMCRAATVVSGYHTYPHVDMREAGLRAGQAIMKLLAGGPKPAMAFGTRPMLPHIMRQSSLDWPNKAIQARAAEMEKEGAVAASFFTGFPHADHPHVGVSAVVVTEGDPDQARRWCDELLDMAWSARPDFIYRVEPLEQSLRRAAAAPHDGRPVVLLDHYDNTSSGGTTDTMAVLKGIIEAGLENVFAFAIFDPEAVATAAAAGVGATVTLDLGGRFAMPAIGLPGKPLRLTARVARVVEGRYRNKGPMSRGEPIDMGLCVVLDTGKVEIAVISRRAEPYDIAAFEALGVDPSSKRYLMLKSRVHWRAGLGGMAGQVIECAGEGVCTSDYSQLPFRRLRRPMYPVDGDAAFSG